MSILPSIRQEGDKIEQLLRKINNYVVLIGNNIQGALILITELGDLLNQLITEVNNLKNELNELKSKVEKLTELKKEVRPKTE